jgi:hypothetical protein
MIRLAINGILKMRLQRKNKATPTPARPPQSAGLSARRGRGKKEGWE